MTRLPLGQRLSLACTCCSTNFWEMNAFYQCLGGFLLIDLFSTLSFKSSKTFCLFCQFFSRYKEKIRNRTRIKAFYSSRVKRWHHGKQSIVIYFNGLITLWTLHWNQRSDSGQTSSGWGWGVLKRYDGGKGLKFSSFLIENRQNFPSVISQVK